MPIISFYKNQTRQNLPLLCSTLFVEFGVHERRFFTWIHRCCCSLSLHKCSWLHYLVEIIILWVSFLILVVKVSFTRACRMVHEQFAYQMRVCVDGTANLCCIVHKWFADHSARTKICWFFVWTQRELDAPGVLSMHRVSFTRLRFIEN